MITAQDLTSRFHAFRDFRFSEPDMWIVRLLSLGLRIAKSRGI